ncbi:MAG: hypothetical protein ACKVZ0_04030 [Gemmatimonadales bacterium]
MRGVFDPHLGGHTTRVASIGTLGLLGLLAGCGGDSIGSLELPAVAAVRAPVVAEVYAVTAIVRYPLGTGARTEVLVAAKDSASNDLSGFKATFVVDSGGGSFVQLPVPDTTRTDSYIFAVWRLSDTARRNVAHVEVGGVRSRNLEVLGGVGRLAIVGGNLQRARPGQPVSAPIVVKASTTRGVDLGAGFPVIFRALDSTGAAKSSDTTRTEADGLATLPAAWVLEVKPGVNTMLVLGESNDTLARITAEGVPPKPASIALAPGPVSVGVVGGFPLTRPEIIVFDSAGQPMPNQPIMAEAIGPFGLTRSFVRHRTDSTGRARIATWRLGGAPGDNRLRVSTPGLPPAPIVLTAAADSLPTKGFSLETRLWGVMPLWVVGRLVDAVRPWERIIIGDLPDSTVSLPAAPNGCHPAIHGRIDDVVVYVRVATIDGPGGDIGHYRYCHLRSNGLPLISQVVLDHDDLAPIDNGVGLVRSLTHFLGHALGFGTLWSRRPDLVNPVSLRFNGPMAVQAVNWLRWTPTTDSLPLDWVPLGDGISPATWGHWSDQVAPDIMAGLLFPNSSISVVTAAAMRDLGYVVDLRYADEVALPGLTPPSFRRDGWRPDSRRRAGRGQ